VVIVGRKSGRPVEKKALTTEMGGKVLSIGSQRWALGGRHRMGKERTELITINRKVGGQEKGGEK